MLRAPGRTSLRPASEPAVSVGSVRVGALGTLGTSAAVVTGLLAGAMFGFFFLTKPGAAPSIIAVGVAAAAGATVMYGLSSEA